LIKKRLLCADLRHNISLECPTRYQPQGWQIKLPFGQPNIPLPFKNLRPRVVHPLMMRGSIDLRFRGLRPTRQRSKGDSHDT